MKTYKPTAVYLMRNKWSESNYKIGVSKDPIRRVAEVEQQYGTDCEILATCWFPFKYDARQAEKIWHKIFDEFLTTDHGGKEWFALDDKAINTFIDWCGKSLPDRTFKDWLYKATPNNSDLKRFVDKIFKALPKPVPNATIDVWRNPTIYSIC